MSDHSREAEIHAAMREGFLTRLAQWDKVAISFGRIGGTVERALPPKLTTLEHSHPAIEGLATRSNARADSLRGKLDGTPLGSPRHDFLTNQLSKEHMLTQSAGNTYDDLAAQAANRRAAQSMTPAPDYPYDAEAIEMGERITRRIQANAPGAIPPAATVPGKLRRQAVA